MTRVMALIGWLAVIYLANVEIGEWAGWMSVAVYVLWAFADELRPLARRVMLRILS